MLWKCKLNKPLPSQCFLSWRFIIAADTQTETIWYQKWSISVRDPIASFQKNCRRTLEFGARKVTECWELSAKFGRSLEDKNLEGSAEVGGLICEVSEGSLDSLSAICYFELGFRGSGYLGLTNQSWLVRYQDYWSESFHLLGSLMLADWYWEIKGD